MSIPDDEKNPKHEGSGRPPTKFMERPKPGKKGPSKSGGPSEEPKDEEQYWGQGRQQKEGKDRQSEE
jgi:hypothetical protein